MIILLIILVLLIALAVWQKDNIKAFYMGLTNDEGSLAEKRQENDKVITETLEKYPELSVRDLTDEEKEALAQGKITNEEVLLLLQGKTTLEELLKDSVVQEVPEPPQVSDKQESEDEKPSEEPPKEPEVIEPTIKEEPEVTPPEVTEPTPTTPTANQEIENLVAQMYVLKAEFTTALKNLENTTLKDYAALSTEEKTAEVKANMMNEVLETVAKMEKDCDTRVNKILERLKVLLTESGQDTALVDAIKSAYKNEKTITKAEYINTYFK